MAKSIQLNIRIDPETQGKVDYLMKKRNYEKYAHLIRALIDEATAREKKGKKDE